MDLRECYKKETKCNVIYDKTKQILWLEKKIELMGEMANDVIPLSDLYDYKQALLSIIAESIKD